MVAFVDARLSAVMVMVILTILTIFTQGRQ